MWHHYQMGQQWDKMIKEFDRPALISDYFDREYFYWFFVNLEKSDKTIPVFQFKEGVLHQQ